MTDKQTPFEEQVLTALKALQTRLDSFEIKIHSLEARMDSQINVLLVLVRERFDNIDKRLGGIERELRLANTRLDHIAVEWTKLNARVVDLEQQQPNAPTSQLR